MTLMRPLLKDRGRIFLCVLCVIRRGNLPSSFSHDEKSVAIQVLLCLWIGMPLKKRACYEGGRSRQRLATGRAKNRHEDCTSIFARSGDTAIQTL